MITIKGIGKVPAARLSLWKVYDGGQPFHKVRDLLAAEGIVARKSTAKSEWEGRWDLLVPLDRLEDAEAILFRAVGRHAVQRTDDLTDPTK